MVANDEFCIGPIETARYLQADGTIHIDITDTTGTNIADDRGLRSALKHHDGLR